MISSRNSSDNLEKVSLRQCRKENSRLARRIVQLEKINLRLLEDIAMHKALREPANRHSSNSTGQEAEEYVCKLLGTNKTERNADHDFVIGRKRFEVKGSKCNLFYSGKNRKHAYYRWTWHNFLGVGRNKTYNRLILVGEADLARQNSYRDRRSPYVIFDVPIAFAKKIVEQRVITNNRFAFHLISHRAGAKTSRLCQQMWDFETTRAELKKRYLG